MYRVSLFSSSISMFGTLLSDFVEIFLGPLKFTLHTDNLLLRLKLLAPVLHYTTLYLLRRKGKERETER